MPLFIYSATDESNNRVKDIIEAENPRALAKKLRSMNLRPNSIDEYKEKPKLFKSNKVSVAEKVFLYKQLELLLYSGIPIADALKLISSLTQNRVSEICLELQKSILDGSSLSIAMGQFPEIFSVFEIKMIGASEATGNTDIVCRRLSETIKKRSELTKQIKMAMIYPSIVLFLSVGMFFLLALVVIPKLVEFIERLGKEIPPITQAMIDVSDFLRVWTLPFVIVFFLGLVFFIIARKKSKDFRYKTDKLHLKVPVFGDVAHLSAMTQISWVSSMLFKSGVTVINSLKITKEILPNLVHKVEMQKAIDKVERGSKLGDALSSPYIDKLLSELVVVGESSGSLDKVMTQSSIHFQEKLEDKNKVLSTLIEPIAILVMASQVGFVYVGFILTLVSATSG